MSADHDVIVNEDGSLQAIYNDDLVEIFTLGHSRIRRASNVEPSTNGRDGWVVDMEPCGGPVLFADGVSLTVRDPHRLPFTTRKAALDAEVAWLKARMAQRRLAIR